MIIGRGKRNTGRKPASSARVPPEPAGPRTVATAHYTQELVLVRSCYAGWRGGNPGTLFVPAN
jgi:hypothetical protein